MRTRRRLNARGFTLIELICTIVILGILAASVVQKFADLRDSAIDASMAGYASALGSAMSLNFVGCQSSGNIPTNGKCAKVTNCTDGSNLLQSPLPNSLPGMNNSHLYINGGYISTTNGFSVGCSVELVINTTPPVVYNKAFTGISAGN